MSKLYVFAAPSGAGKTTIVQHLLSKFNHLAFSISATTRPKRDHEVDGKHYHFLSAHDFRQKIKDDAFVEWEEVYPNRYYGTLKSEVRRLWDLNKDILFDIDVKGALNIKNCYPKECLTVFVKPPSIDTLIKRLKLRNTEDTDSLKTRISRMKEEFSYEKEFDYILINDILDVALTEAERIIKHEVNI
jgi:guanylate kinase